MTSLARSAPSEPPRRSPYPLRDSCGRHCQEITLPDLFGTTAAASIFIVPGACVVLLAPTDVRWTAQALRTFAHRVAGRVPTVLDQLPTALADELAAAIVTVLDWAQVDVA